METTISTIGFYPNRYWFWYFRKNRYLKGFVFRIFGIHFIVKEENSLGKYIAINKAIQLLKADAKRN